MLLLLLLNTIIADGALKGNLIKWDIHLALLSEREALTEFSAFYVIRKYLKLGEL